MANRYWVTGGTGNWSSTSNWSATSGGASGASVPVAGDITTLDANSGTGTVVLDVNAVSGTLNHSAFAGSISNAAGNTITLTGTGTIFASGNAYTLLHPITIVASDTSATARTISSGSGVTESKAYSLKVTGGTGNFTINSRVKNADFTGYSGQLQNTVIICYGSWTGATGMTYAAGTNAISFSGTSGPYTLDFKGVTIDAPLTFNGVGGTWTLGDNLTVGSTRAVTLTNGTLNGNGKNFSFGSFALGSGTKTLTLGSGTWTAAGSGTAWDANTNVANLTVSASTGTITMTSASAKTFAGGAKTWPTLNQGGTGALTIQQSNTFTSITNTVQPATVTLTAGTTQTVSTFGLSGTSGNLITLNSSSAGSQATLSDASGLNSVSYMSIKDNIATGGSLWDAPAANGNVNAGNNIGWNFGLPFTYDIEFSPALRSFTERNRF